jgi:hypothetical protein
MSRTISKGDRVIDSRDVIARIDELESEREALADNAEALEEWDNDNGEELAEFKALADKADGYAEDWKHGATLIHEDYFVEYCRELASDIGDMPREIPGYIVIDWDATAENLKFDYTEVDWGGETYYVR